MKRPKDTGRCCIKSYSQDMTHHTYPAEFIDEEKLQTGFKARTAHHVL